jgi:hypothetical protein
MFIHTKTPAPVMPNDQRAILRSDHRLELRIAGVFCSETITQNGYVGGWCGQSIIEKLRKRNPEAFTHYSPADLRTMATVLDELHSEYEAERQIVNKTSGGPAGGGAFGIGVALVGEEFIAQMLVDRGRCRQPPTV